MMILHFLFCFGAIGQRQSVMHLAESVAWEPAIYFFVLAHLVIIAPNPSRPQKLACHRWWNDLDRLVQATETILSGLELHVHATDGPAFRSVQNVCESA
jgi:hypothetical protein